MSRCSSSSPLRGVSTAGASVPHPAATGRARFPLLPSVAVSLRQALACLRNALQAAFAAYPCRDTPCGGGIPRSA